MISTVTSVLTNFISISWIMEPFQRETNCWIGKLPLLPLFLFRMLAWVIIVASLKSSATAVFVMNVTFNFSIIYGKTDQLFETAMLSVVFPVTKYPSAEISESTEKRVSFWLTMSGNILLMTSMVAIYILYWMDAMNPWCTTDNVVAHEEMLSHICFLMLTLFFTSTFTTIVFKTANRDR